MRSDDEAARRDKRKELKKLRLAHLHSLWTGKRLTSIEVSWLLRLSPEVARLYVVHSTIPRIG